jgi:cysteine desulfurase
VAGFEAPRDKPRRLQPLVYGGNQERGLRPGTVPVALAIGLGEAARLAAAEWQSRRAAAVKIREQFLNDLQAVEHHINGDPARSMPHVVNVSFPGVDSEALMLACRDRIAISNGSACTSSSYRPSHVLLAMGLDEDEAGEAIRVSWGAGCHDAHIGNKIVRSVRDLNSSTAAQ